MQFTKPTTKSKMYEVLNEIFHYYRVKRVEFEEAPLEELSLKKLSYTRSTDEKLIQKAEKLISADMEKEFNEQASKLLAEMSSLNLSVTSEEELANKHIEEIKALYDESEEKIRKQIESNGLIHTSAYTDKLTYLENERNLRISTITAEKDFKILQYNSRLFELNEKLVELENNYSSISEKAIEAKAIELRLEEEKIEREVFKYNNGLDEKEQRYKNSIIQANANRMLKYKEITVAELSKDQLVEMGYYEDVVSCVCAYYNTLDPNTAFPDINSEEKLTIYLDDYYPNVVYMYAMRSGVITS